MSSSPETQETDRIVEDLRKLEAMLVRESVRA